MLWRGEEASFLPELETRISRGHLPRTREFVVRARAVDKRRCCQPTPEAQGRWGCCRGRGRPSRYLARLTLMDPYQKWRLSTNFSVTSVPSHLLTEARHTQPQAKKKSFCEAGLPAFV